MRTTLALVLALGACLAQGLAAQEADIPVDFDGELRVRPEWDARAVGVGDDAAVLLRTRFGALADIGAHARAYAQLQVARAFGENPGAGGGGIGDRLGLHQGYIDLSDVVGVTPVTLRAGRQEIRLGNERLVGAVGWSNTGRAFDAFRVLAGAGPDRWRLSLLGAVVRARARLSAPGLDPRRNGDDGSDHLFSGAYLELPAADLFVLYDRNADEAGFDGADRGTAGGRISGDAPGGLRYDAEGAYQWGTRRASGPVDAPQTIGAWFLGARLASSVPLPRVRSARVGVDWLSGDDDVSDDTYGAFSTLYATNHKFYGLMDLFLNPAAQTHGRGLVDGILGLELNPSDNLTVDAALHGFWYAEPLDAARRVGWELDLTLPYELDDGVSVQTGYSLFRTGDGAPRADLGSPGELLHWGYVQILVRF